MLYRILKIILISKQTFSSVKNMEKRSTRSTYKRQAHVKTSNFSLKHPLNEKLLKCDESQNIDNSIEMSKSSNKSPLKSKKKKNSLEVSESVKITNVPDIEDGCWKPNNWETILENIIKMREENPAPVDSMGCEKCNDSEAPSNVRRYQTLISLMLSSQTKDQVTYAAMQRLIAHGLTVENILNTSDKELGDLIYPVGFWSKKVKYIKNASQILKDQYNCDIPSTLKDLCSLPGVGPKMANLAMSVGWNETVGIAVDTHVHRISNRLGLVQKQTKTPEQTRLALEKWLPRHLWKAINFNLVGFGQTVCLPVLPKCEECINFNHCPFAKGPRKNRKVKDF